MLSPMPPSRLRRFVLGAAVFVPATLLAAAGGGAPQAGGGAARVKFRVVGGDNAPVSDLAPGDVTLRVDGRPREITSLEFVEVGNGAAPAAPSPFDPPFATNDLQAGGRDLYILVDEESIAPGRDAGVKEAATILLEALAPGERAALVSVRQGGPNLGLTSNHDQVRSTIASLAGYADLKESAVDLTCRTVRTMQAMQAVFANASAGAPPTIVFFSTGVAALQAGKTVTLGRPSGSDADLCLLTPDNYKQLGDAAQNANATFFALELLDASASARLPEANGGLEDLAGATSGDFLRVGANMNEQMARIATTPASYYVATFAPENSDRGGAKRLEVTVARGGVSVKAPREVTLARGGKARGSSPRDMIRVATPFTDLPLRAAAYASRNPEDKKVRVLALFEPIEPGTKLNAATIMMYDKSGSGAAQWNGRSPDFAGETTVAALVAEPGEYRMRVAATDASGRSGAVDLQVSAALIEAGPIHLGDLVLGKSVEGAPVPVMQFHGESEALAMIELYGRPAGPLVAYVEVLDKPDGEALHAVPLSPSATSEPDRFLLAASVPLGDLKPGDYLVRAVVGVQGQEGKVTRTLRKTGS